MIRQVSHGQAQPIQPKQQEPSFEYLLKARATGDLAAEVITEVAGRIYDFSSKDLGLRDRFRVVKLNDSQSDVEKVASHTFKNKQFIGEARKYPSV